MYKVWFVFTILIFALQSANSYALSSDEIKKFRKALCAEASFLDRNCTKSEKEIQEKLKLTNGIESKARLINFLCGVNPNDQAGCKTKCQSKGMLLLKQGKDLDAVSEYQVADQKVKIEECYKQGKYTSEESFVSVSSFLNQLKVSVNKGTSTEEVLEKSQDNGACSVKIAKALSCKLLNHWHMSFNLGVNKNESKDLGATSGGKKGSK